MFDIGLQELLVIFVIALLVVGPKRLPEVGRMVARALRELRRVNDEFRSTVETNLKLNEFDAAPQAPAVAEPLPAPADPGASSDLLPSPSPNGAALPAEPYFARRGARLFHSRACSWVGRLDESERLAFIETGAAQAQGFLPCPVCEPTMPGP